MKVILTGPVVTATVSNLREWDTSAEVSNVKVELERRAGRLESSDRYIECISVFQLSY